jgi:release factor glutamine methyltransferase
MMRLLTCPGVFHPRSDSWLLAGVVAERVGRTSPRSVLDPFAGSGIQAIAAALAGVPDVTAVDISRRAVVCAWANARLNGVRVRARHGDLFAPVAGERFDTIVANPPYLPGGDGVAALCDEARAWEGGPDGRTLIDRVCSEAPAHLHPGGELLIVHSSVCGRARTERALAARGFEVEIARTQRGPLGPLLSARAETLRGTGLLAGNGEAPAEEMIVFAARLTRAPTNRDPTVDAEPVGAG